MLALEWMSNTQNLLETIKTTQPENIRKASELMADSIEAERWVHTFGCGHATLPAEEIYPRIGGFVGFHPMLEQSLTFFTRIQGDTGIHQFLFLERAEGFGKEIMKSYQFDSRDTMWLFSHSGINNVNIDVALEAQKIGMKVVVLGSAEEYRGKKTRHSSGKNLFELADVVVDTCVPAEDASVEIKNHKDKISPVSTMGFIACSWMIVTTVAEILVDRGVKLYIHPSHNIPGDTTARERLDEALNEYKRRLNGA